MTDPDMDDEIAMGLEGIKRLLRNWAFENLLDYDLIELTMLNDACDLGPKTRVMSSGASPWSDTDPVRLTPDGYKDLALIINKSVQAGDVVSVSGSDTEEACLGVHCDEGAGTPLKRERGVTPARIAGWLVRRLDADHGRWGGGDGGRSGHQGGHLWGHRGAY
jgi:hypothetical protein